MVGVCEQHRRWSDNDELVGDAECCRGSARHPASACVRGGWDARAADDVLM